MATGKGAWLLGEGAWLRGEGVGSLQEGVWPPKGGVARRGRKGGVATGGRGYKGGGVVAVRGAWLQGMGGGEREGIC